MAVDNVVIHRHIGLWLCRVCKRMDILQMQTENSGNSYNIINLPGIYMTCIIACIIYLLDNMKMLKGAAPFF